MITQDSKNIDEFGKEDELRAIESEITLLEVEKRAIESEITRLEAKRGLR